jgi:hypothetical protein
MRDFVDGQGNAWVASAREEDTPRHHGRWYLVFHPEGDAGRILPVPEVRWQNRPTAERTLLTMSVFELQRRLQTVLARSGSTAVSSEA